MKQEERTALTDTELPEGVAVRETKLGLEAWQDFLFDLLYCVTVESAHLQGLTDFSITAHCKQHLQLLYQIHRNMHRGGRATSRQNWNKLHLFLCFPKTYIAEMQKVDWSLDCMHANQRRHICLYSSVSICGPQVNMKMRRGLCDKKRQNLTTVCCISEKWTERSEAATKGGA